jgi:hypothetical protein
MAVQIRIRVIGDKRIIHALAYDYPDRLVARTKAALLEAAQEAAAIAIPLAPIRTGQLRRSIRVEEEGGQKSLRVFLVAGGRLAQYTKYHEFGTLENRIDPSDVRLLSAAIRGGFGAKSGRGITPKLFLHKGAESVRGRLGAIIGAKLNSLAAELNLK